MGYIQEFGVTLDAMLKRHGLPDEARAEVVRYVKETVLESYRNGVEQGKQEATRKPAAVRKDAPRRSEPRGRSGRAERRRR